MAGYTGGAVKKMIEIQESLKFVLRKIGRRELSLNDAEQLILFLKKVEEFAPLDRSEVKDPINTPILMDVWAGMKEQFSDSFLASYKDVLDPIVNYFTGKLDYDSLYQGLFNYFLGEILRRGYHFPGHNRPNSVLWQDIPPKVKARLVTSLKSNYSLYQERCKTIDEKLPPDDPVNIQNKASRYEQYINRVLTDFEREVVAWGKE